MSNFQDVGAFHLKFDLPHHGDGVAPHLLDVDAFRFRVAFMLEELAEYAEAQGAKRLAVSLASIASHVDLIVPELDEGNLPDALDALVDLSYIVLGSAHLGRLPFDEAWAEVQRANMTKERASGADDPRSKRGHQLDVVKPSDFAAPDHRPALRAAGWRG